MPFELYSDNKHPIQNTVSGSSFLDLQNPYSEIRKFLIGICSGTLFVSVVSNMVELGAGCVQKAALYWRQKKTKYVLMLFGGTPGAISPKFLYPSVHCGPRFHPNPFRFGGVITEKPL